MSRMRAGKSGSALFLCILTVASVGLCGVFGQASILRAREAEMARAMRAQINAILVSGNSDLMKRYGLTAYAIEDQTMDVFYRVSRMDAATVVPELVPLEPFSDVEVFGEAVDTYMRYRMPGLLLSHAADCLQTLGDTVSGLSNPQTGTGVSEGTLKEWLCDFDYGSLLQPPETPEEEPESSGEELEVTEEDDSEETPENTLRQKITGFLADKILGDVLLGELQDLQATMQLMEETQIGAGDGSPGFPDLLNPNEVSAFIDRLDDWLTLDQDPLYQKLGQVEYIMGQCSRRLPEQASARESCSYRTGIAGRDFADLYPVEGPDVERILSGRDDADSAEAWVFTVILGIRFALSMLSIYANSSRLARAQSIASALSGVIALISVGSVVIPEPLLTAVVAAVWGFGEALTDTRSIVDGGQPPLIPGFDALSLGYGGYLRIFLLLETDPVMLERLQNTVVRNVPGTYYRALQIRVPFRNRILSLSGRCAE